MRYKIAHGDSLEVLKHLPDESVSAVITDPPYGLSNTDPKHVIEAMGKWAAGERAFVPQGRGFMGKTWDAFVPPPALWDECYRVLKPGGHLLSFAGTRTFDLMTLSIRFAGFEIRDSLAWIYGSGFPKSQDVSKAIDKQAGAEREVVSEGAPVRRMIPGADQNKTGSWIKDNGREFVPTVTAPATEDAQTWQGWGTALKPAFEPIVCARKPLGEKTVAKNVLAHGTGALNIDATRIATSDRLGGGAESRTTSEQKGDEGWTRPWMDDPEAREAHASRVRANVEKAEALGRWPANVVLGHTEDCEQIGTKKIKAITGTNSGRGAGTKAEDSDVYGKYAGREDMERGAPVGKGDADGMEAVEDWRCAPGCPVAALDAQSGERKAGGKVKGTEPSRTGQNDIYGTWGRVENKPYRDTGGASRFFYCAKAAKRERPSVETEDGKRLTHPTVKPLTLMRWLVRMITPPGGIVLDPFAGSGTTIEAGCLEGFSVLGIEREADYIDLINVRMEKHREEAS